MAKDATLGLLRALRKRDTSVRAERAAVAAGKRAEAERAVEHAATSRSRALADAEGAADAERQHLDAGRATAGELGRGHHHRLGVEARAERSERDRVRAEEGLARARVEEAQA